MKSIIYLIVAFISLTGFAQTKIQEISVQHLQDLLNQKEDINILDIRTPKEFESGHIENAININYYDKDFAEQVQSIDKSKPLVIYCHSGYRTHRAIKIFEQSSFDTVYDLTEGYVGWQKLK